MILELLDLIEPSLAPALQDEPAPALLWQAWAIPKRLCPSVQFAEDVLGCVESDSPFQWVSVETLQDGEGGRYMQVLGSPAAMTVEIIGHFGTEIVGTLARPGARGALVGVGGSVALSSVPVYENEVLTIVDACRVLREWVVSGRLPSGYDVRNTEY